MSEKSITRGDDKKTSMTLSPRILVVDDEADITKVISSGLTRYGHLVTAFNDPVVALANYKPGLYDLVILDIRMPQISGFELARKIWEIDSEAHICFLTAFEIYESEAERVFPSLRTKCFLLKPIRIENLVQHIETQLDIPTQNLPFLG